MFFFEKLVSLLYFNFLVINNELEKRKELRNKMQESLDLQPNLERKTRDKIKQNEHSINNSSDYKRRLIALMDDLNMIIKANFEMNNPLASDPEVYNHYILVAAFYIGMCVKYPSDMRLKLFKGMLNMLPDTVDFENHTIYEVLYSEAYLVECLKKKIPMSLSFVDNLAIYDLLSDLVLPYPLIIDPTGLFMQFLKSKYGQNFKLESYSVDTNTITNIETAITTGQCLALVNFDQDLLRLVQPLIEMKHEAVVNKLYKKHLFNEEERENQRNQSDEPELVVMDQDAEEVNFHGKNLKLHKDFRLVLILRDGHTKIPKFLLEKVLLINNDISHEGTWKELVSDMLINYCYPGEKEALLNKYFKERLFSEANEEFNQVCLKCARQEEIGNLDAMFVEDLENMVKNLKKKYRIGGAALSPIKMQNTNPSTPSLVLKPSNEESKQPHSAQVVSSKPLLSQSPSPSKTYAPDVQMKSEENEALGNSQDLSNLDLGNTNTDPHKAKTTGALDNELLVSPVHHRTMGVIEERRESLLSTNSKRSFLRDRRNTGESGNSSLFLEGRKVPDYCSFLSKFKEIQDILQKYSTVINQLHLVYQTMEMIHRNLGDLYGLSVHFRFLSLQHAFEIGVANGFLKNNLKRDDQEKIKEFNTMVAIYFYHQIYSALRSDHQNIFSVFFSIIFLKCTREFQNKAWEIFLRGNVDRNLLKEYYESPELGIKWLELREALITYHKGCENSFPPPTPFILEDIEGYSPENGAYEIGSQKAQSFKDALKDAGTPSLKDAVTPRSANKMSMTLPPNTRLSLPAQHLTSPISRKALIGLQVQTATSNVGATKDFSFSRAIIRHMVVPGSRERLNPIHNALKVSTQIRAIKEDDNKGNHILITAQYFNNTFSILASPLKKMENVAYLDIPKISSLT